MIGQLQRSDSTGFRFVSGDQSRSCRLIATCMVIASLAMEPIQLVAGMPALLPTGWTAESPQPTAEADLNAAAAIRVQTISYFLVVFLACGWIVQRSWNSFVPRMFGLRHIDYRRTLSFLILWGLAFIVVLTMISGARELMTPGAWKKQGWTYQLNDSARQDTDPATSLASRQRGLEKLRTALWQYAATHGGQLPDARDSAIQNDLWQIPNSSGLTYLSLSDRVAEDAGRIYVFEPDADGDERLVLLTNGFIGTMNSAQIKAAIQASKSSSNPSESEVTK